MCFFILYCPPKSLLNFLFILLSSAKMGNGLTTVPHLLLCVLCLSIFPVISTTQATQVEGPLYRHSTFEYMAVGSTPDQHQTRAINSSASGNCLRDNTPSSVKLTIGTPATPRSLAAFDCKIYHLLINSTALGARDLAFAITSTTVPVPTDTFTTLKFYREELINLGRDSMHDLTSMYPKPIW
jgi:hypothetical protein